MLLVVCSLTIEVQIHIITADYMTQQNVFTYMLWTTISKGEAMNVHSMPNICIGQLDDEHVVHINDIEANKLILS